MKLYKWQNKKKDNYEVILIKYLLNQMKLYKWQNKKEVNYEANLIKYFIVQTYNNKKIIVKPCKVIRFLWNINHSAPNISVK